jgi:hypothetical protein
VLGDIEILGRIGKDFERGWVSISKGLAAVEGKSFEYLKSLVV